MKNELIFPDDIEILNIILSTTDKDRGYRLLVGKYKEKLYYHIRRMVHDHDDADDILQNTFIKVIRHLPGFQQQSALFTWLYRIATNECLNFLNNKKNKHHDTLEGSGLNIISAEVDLDADDILLKLNQAIEILPDKQRVVFNLRYYDELSYQEISEITDTSVGALKASYHHAIKKIEGHLKR